MPSVELFESQPESYREALIPCDHPAIVTVEAGITGPWRVYWPSRADHRPDRFGISASIRVGRKIWIYWSTNRSSG